MKRALFLLTVLGGNLFASTFVMPATMDAGSVQANLKKQLFARLQVEGPVVGPYKANLTGNYGAVTLEDAESQIVCREFPADTLAVQMFECRVTIKDGNPQQYASLRLPLTTDSASTQSELKEILFNELEAHGPTPTLFGSYAKIVLQDRSTKVTCTENSQGMLAVQQFSCEFVGRK